MQIKNILQLQRLMYAAKKKSFKNNIILTIIMVIVDKKEYGEKIIIQKITNVLFEFYNFYKLVKLKLV